jgi:hypothetical protein
MSKSESEEDVFVSEYSDDNSDEGPNDQFHAVEVSSLEEEESNAINDQKRIPVKPSRLNTLKVSGAEKKGSSRPKLRGWSWTAMFNAAMFYVAREKAADANRSAKIRRWTGKINEARARTRSAKIRHWTGIINEARARTAMTTSETSFVIVNDPHRSQVRLTPSELKQCTNSSNTAGRW